MLYIQLQTKKERPTSAWYEMSVAANDHVLWYDSNIAFNWFYHLFIMSFWNIILVPISVITETWFRSDIFCFGQTCSCILSDRMSTRLSVILICLPLNSNLYILVKHARRTFVRLDFEVENKLCNVICKIVLKCY